MKNNEILRAKEVLQILIMVSVDWCNKTNSKGLSGPLSGLSGLLFGGKPFDLYDGPGLPRISLCQTIPAANAFLITMTYIKNVLQYMRTIATRI